MDFTQLVYFVEIARLQNVTKAAERLHVAQPALSQSLQKLEQELGTKLFDRIGKSIRLNEDGRIMFRYSEQILELYHNAREELADRLKSETGTIKLKFLCASDLIPDIISSFQAFYPGIGFKIVQSSELMDYDFCITSTYNNVAPENGRLLHDEEILRAVPPRPSSGPKEALQAGGSERGFLHQSGCGQAAAQAHGHILQGGKLSAQHRSGVRQSGAGAQSHSR